MSGLRGLGLRIAVAAALLVLAFRMALPAEGPGPVAALASAFEAGAAGAAGWFALALAVMAASFAVGTWRFRGLLAAGGIAIDFASLYRAYVVAGFFNLVLPGAILGDAYRVVDARADAGRGGEVLGLVVVERLMSLAALGSLGLVAIPAVPLAAEHRALAASLVGASALFLVGTVLALLPVTNRALRRLVPLVARVSRRAGRATGGSLDALAVVARRPLVIAWAYALSLVNQGLPVAAVLALAQPLAADVAWSWYVVIVPFVTLVALLPVSIGGAGVRESLYVGLFGAVGMRAEVALTLSLLTFAASLAWGLVGLGLFAWGRRGGPRPAAVALGPAPPAEDRPAAPEPPEIVPDPER